MRRSAAVAAAVASIARSHRKLMLQKQRPLLEKLKTLKLTAGHSPGVRPGHAVIDLHPDVFKEVEFEEREREEMSKKLKDFEMGTGVKDRVSSSLLEYEDPVSQLNKDKSIDILGKKVTNDSKLKEELIKAKISANLEELHAILLQIESHIVSRQAKQATKSSMLRNYGKKLLDILRGVGKRGDEK